MSFIIVPAAHSAGQLYFCACSGNRPVGFLMTPYLYAEQIFCCSALLKMLAECLFETF
ncbi:MULTISPECIES: hypothetical protein [unclassified Desulfovibrio]|uniref:hypothetical protein n=1 Tax=unclassified Desulfovibrio TaxID=2593640 RepID=UPI002FD88219